MTFFEVVGKMVLSITSVGLVLQCLYVVTENLSSSKLRYLTNSLGTGTAFWTGVTTIAVIMGWIWTGELTALMQPTALFAILPLTLGIGFFYAYTRTMLTKVQDQKGVDQSHEEHSATE